MILSCVLPAHNMCQVPLSSIFILFSLHEKGTARRYRSECPKKGTGHFFFVRDSLAFVRDFKKTPSDKCPFSTLSWKVKLCLCYNFPMQIREHMKIVITDFEGTLSDHSHRLEFAYKNQWDEFFSRLDGDTLRYEVWDQIKAFGLPVVIVTGVWEKFRPQMEAWLHKNNVTYDLLYMKQTGDQRPSEVTKSELFETHLKNYEIAAVFDDLPAVIEMFRNKGLNVIDVGPKAAPQEVGEALYSPYSTLR